MRAWTKIRELGRFWVQFTGAAMLLTFVLGPFAPIILVTGVLTLVLPVLALVVWGQSLDEKLGWGDVDEGPW